MSAINAKREEAQKDLKPVYKNIKDNGEKAWVLVRSGTEEYYISYSDVAIVWAYTRDDEASVNNKDGVKISIVSIGSYSATANFLGVSGYIWENVPVSRQVN